MNAMWKITYLVKGPANIAPAATTRLGAWRDGAGYRGICYLSSADSVKSGKKRASNTLKDRLVKAGAKRTAIQVVTCDCVG